MPTILDHAQPREVAQLQQQSDDVTLIDVRTPVEFRELHAVGARNVPLDTLDATAIARIAEEAADRQIFVLCQSGARAAQACRKFAEAGVANAVSVEGGTSGWVEARLPVERGKKAVSLERQVRIAAGSLVVLGSLLAWLVHPGFLALPAFVGAGLVFAGVTDTCGMGMLLARMPWNQVRPCDLQ